MLFIVDPFFQSWWIEGAKLSRFSVDYESENRARKKFPGNSRGRGIVAETVCMSVRDVCEFEEFAQSRLPAPHDAFQLPSSTPKEKRIRDFWRCFQRR